MQQNKAAKIISINVILCLEVQDQQNKAGVQNGSTSFQFVKMSQSSPVLRSHQRPQVRENVESKPTADSSLSWSTSVTGNMSNMCNKKSLFTNHPVWWRSMFGILSMAWCKLRTWSKKKEVGAPLELLTTTLFLSLGDPRSALGLRTLRDTHHDRKNPSSKTVKVDSKNCISLSECL